MIFQNSVWPDMVKKFLEDPLFGYMRGVNLIFWLTTIGIYCLAAVIFFKRARADNLLDSQRSMFFSFGFLFTCMIITVFFYALAYTIEPYFDRFKMLGYTIYMISPIPMTRTIEKYMFRKTKFFFTIFSIGLVVFCIVFTLISPDSSMLRTITQSAAPIILLIMFVLYLMLILKSVGNIRKKALRTYIGFIFLIMGIILDSEAVMAMFPSPVYFLIAPTVFSVGTLIVLTSQKID